MNKTQVNTMQTQHIPVITIDGPSASGKGTVAQLVADKLGFAYLDSGALYRVVAFAAQQNDIAWDDANAVADCAKALHIKFKNGQVFLNDHDISEEIRREQMGKGASQVAVHAPVRAALIDLQHSFHQAPGLVADGRDMGTVIFPSAPLKIFLTASTEVRAERRYKQLIGKNQPANYESILQDLQERDARDKGRASAPLVMAENAILLETDNLGITDAVNTVLNAYQQVTNS
ncbi:MAG: (d)CMP kinase [Methylotenera sp.]|uniref:(d)CMP kinase n=1 Tax=Methylotenera sp. TaxID=2051956 RepID=UPI0027183341|nr:(d)CMP kinase [Methylotenera sp.]MDO9150748.1 (d)CMP kinase [Methylotenera sp.]